MPALHCLDASILIISVLVSLAVGFAWGRWA